MLIKILMVVTTICMKLMVEVYNLENSEKYQVRYHDSCVLSLKYAHKNDWFISTGKDQIINGWKSPYAANIFNVSLKIIFFNLIKDF